VSYGIQAEIIGVKELAQATADAAKQSGKIISEFLNDTAREVVSSLQDVTPTGATAHLRQSMHAEFATPAKQTAIVGTNVKYAPFVEYGTKPHRPPTGPNSSLRLWARRKLGDEKAVYAIARSIAARGTKGQGYMKKAKDYGQNYFSSHADFVTNEIMKILGR
jgi:hypothetical protein